MIRCRSQQTVKKQDDPVRPVQPPDARVVVRFVAVGREPSGLSSLSGHTNGRLAPFRYNSGNIGLAPGGGFLNGLLRQVAWIMNRQSTSLLFRIHYS